MWSKTLRRWKFPSAVDRCECKISGWIHELPKIAGLLCLLTFAFAQESPKPEFPDKIKTPAGQELALVAHATGFQIYTRQRGADGQPAWLLKAP